MIVFGTACLTVVLLVRSVVFEDLVGVFGDADFFGGELVEEGVAEVVGGDFELFDFGEGGSGAFELDG